MSDGVHQEKQNVGVRKPIKVPSRPLTSPSVSFFASKMGIIVMHSGEGSGTPLQYSCLENPMDGGAWWAAVHGVAKSDTTGAT